VHLVPRRESLEPCLTVDGEVDGVSQKRLGGQAMWSQTTWLPGCFRYVVSVGNG
jgi:hypothetical protein